MPGTEAGEIGRSSTPAAAFARLADEHLDAAYRLACAILRDPTDAQDATHDAFVQAWQKWSTLRDPDRFQAWFDRILINTCRNRLRRTTRWQMRDISSEVIVASGDEYARTQDRDVIDAALAELSLDHRIVVALRYYGDLPIDAIAARLDIPPGTVQSRLHYALRQLHGIIDGFEPRGMTR
jgi:RNA polymerase sigma-70 factor, ECF subfamily